MEWEIAADVCRKILQLPRLSPQRNINSLRESCESNLFEYLIALPPPVRLSGSHLAPTKKPPANQTKETMLKSDSKFPFIPLF